MKTISAHLLEKNIIINNKKLFSDVIPSWKQEDIDHYLSSFFPREDKLYAFTTSPRKVDNYLQSSSIEYYLNKQTDFKKLLSTEEVNYVLTELTRDIFSLGYFRLDISNPGKHGRKINNLIINIDVNKMSILLNELNDDLILTLVYDETPLFSMNFSDPYFFKQDRIINKLELEVMLNNNNILNYLKYLFSSCMSDLTKFN